MSATDDPFASLTDPAASREPVRRSTSDDGAALPPPIKRVVLDRTPRPIDPATDVVAPIAKDQTLGPERLRIEHVSIGYGEARVVKDLSLSIHQGEVLALIGPSGCGKTTFLRSMNRLTEQTASAWREGQILLDGRDIYETELPRLRRKIAMVFQQPNPFPMSIFDNIAYAIRVQNRKTPGKAEVRERVVDSLRRAGLYDELGGDLDKPALRLSGGQQQRLCIARAIATNPEVLLMDEPCSALDPRSTAVIEDLIGELRESLAIVIVTHNLAQAHRVADNVAFMYLGDLVEHGPVDQVFEQPRAQRTRDYVAGVFG
ncbi:MAG: phosphate ABC transporter ATP-binding protein [Solirubrobacteraceae bacterium]|nr:phosphate ABC transporter ATP-binding protein [Patulibacter sp.]